MRSTVTARESGARRRVRGVDDARSRIRGSPLTPLCGYIEGLCDRGFKTNVCVVGPNMGIYLIFGARVVFFSLVCARAVAGWAFRRARGVSRRHSRARCGGVDACVRQ